MFFLYKNPGPFNIVKQKRISTKLLFFKFFFTGLVIFCPKKNLNPKNEKV